MAGKKINTFPKEKKLKIHLNFRNVSLRLSIFTFNGLRELKNIPVVLHKIVT